MENGFIVTLPMPLKEIERMAIETALAMTNNSQKDAAIILGITPRVINYKMKTHGIPRPHFNKAKAS